VGKIKSDVDYLAKVRANIKELQDVEKEIKDRISAHARTNETHEVAGNEYKAVFQGRSTWTVEPADLLAFLKRRNLESAFPRLVKVDKTEAGKFLAGDKESLGTHGYDSWAAMKIEKIS
jgi:hypothetical protein